jgi:putative aldouronate transport system permease protein
MVKGTSDRVYQGVCATVAIIAGLICLYPLLYSVFLSFCSESEWIESGGTIWYFPKSPTLTAYIKIFGSTDVIMRALGMSVLRTVLGTVFGLMINVLAAYALSRNDLPGKGIIMKVMLFTILFNGGLIPTYLTVQETGLINTIWALIIPGLFSAWNVLILKQFMEGIPREMEEAGEIDGVTQIGKLLYIILPMSKPVMSAICMFTMVGHWNSWFDVSIYIKDSSLWTLQYYIKVNFDNTSGLNQGQLDFLISQGATVSSITMKMALTVISILPMLVIYPFFQKYFTQGVYVGAVKG